MNDDTTARIVEMVDGQVEPITALRRLLHRCPEPGFEEKQTSEAIAHALDGLGLSVRRGVAGTGIVADLDTGCEGPYLMIRADMDALGSKDEGTSECAGGCGGYVHSCGHDGHSASVVGVARVLTAMRRRLTGRIRFVFQPAEETCRGARALIEQGVLEPKPDAAISLHAWPGLETDSVACRRGAMMASCDVLSITVTGEGGHGARPHLAKNPLPGMARIVEQLGRIDGRDRVVSLCTASVGTEPNVIADEGRLTGTVRTLSPEARNQTLEEIQRRVRDVCDELALQSEVRFEGMSPAVVTDDGLFEIWREVGERLLGADKLVELDSPSMGSEDFGCYLDYIPGLIFRVGMGPDAPQLHDRLFEFNDEGLRTAMLMLCGIAARICGKDRPR